MTEKPKTISKPKLVHKDARGIIEQQADGTFNSVLRIVSKKGAIRANHYHQKDSHLCYLTYGSLDYYERPVGSTEKPVRIRVKAGDLFFTPPMVEHAMHFLKDSEFYCFTTAPRSKDAYEDDIIRVEVFTPKKPAAKKSVKKAKKK